MNERAGIVGGGAPAGSRAGRWRLLLCALAAGCAGWQGDLQSRAYPGRTLDELLAAASDAIVEMDAQVLAAEVDAVAQEATLTLLTQWRRPRPESAVLRVWLGTREGGVTLELEGTSLASYRVVGSDRAPPGEEARGEPECPTCARARRVERQLFVQMNGGRALANLRAAQRAFVVALEGALP